MCIIGPSAGKRREAGGLTFETGELIFETGDSKTDDRSLLRSTLERDLLTGVLGEAALSSLSTTLSFFPGLGASEWVSSSDDTACDERDVLFSRFGAAAFCLLAGLTIGVRTSSSSSSSSGSLAGAF